MTQKHLLLFALAILITLTGWKVGHAGESALSMDDPPLPANEAIAADETVRMMLDWVDADGVIRPPASENRIIPGPVYLDMAVPPAVRARIHAALIAGGMRIAADPQQYHTIRIQWQPDNILETQRSGVSRRVIRSEVYFSWLDADREIQKTWQASFSHEDEIPTDLVAEVTGTWPPAAFQQESETGRRTLLRRIAEPAVITGAIAVTIYLLYNVRS
ncbi:MAG: hypothetical protein EA363_06475 [Balneolaceae bacterium]|nr:MAG: hypothetical protein EA363_06475 [Balneolaceae bacterium]